MADKKSQNGAPRYRSGEFPIASRPEERAAAQERVRAFPYRFPRDHRKLGGKFSVEENARRLMRYFYFERRLMQAVGAWTLAIPEFEVKVESGRHLFYHADAAKLLGVTEADVLTSIASGDLKAKKIGAAYRITRAAFDEFLK